MKLIQNIKKNTIILLSITVIILYIILKDDFNDIVKTFKMMDIKFILVALLFYFLSIFIKGFVNYLITNNKEKLSLKEAVKHNLIAQFFNGITPFSTGGQPMEVYMLTEHDIPVTKATNQTIQSFIFYQIALVICGILAVLYNFFYQIFPKVKILQHLVLLGFAINIAVVIVLIMISYSKSITKKISKVFVILSKKFHLKIKEENIYTKMEDYYNGFQELKHRKGLMVIGVILNIASLLCLYSIPLFILYGMNDFAHLTIVETLTSSAYVYVIGAFVPIPGASGGIEFGFTKFYSNFITSSKLSAVLLLWRFITYYLGIILGALLFNLEKKVKK